MYFIYMETSPLLVKSEVLGYWAVETLGDLQSTSRCQDLWLKCKTNTLPILMHQMRTSCLSVMLIDAPDAHFKSLNDAQAEKVNSGEKM
jgi:hypothetical protein